MPNTYDLTTPVGQARLHAADTDTANAIFTDAEYSYFLTVTSQDPISAAAFALESLAADASRMAYAIKSQGLDIDRKTFADSLRAQAASLRSQAGVGGSVDSPDQVFSTDDTNDSIIGTMTGW